MPDLNLVDDEGVAEEMPEGAEEIASSGGGGGASKVIIIVLILLIVAGGGAYLLNSMGIVHLWGSKPTTVTVEEELPQEYFDEQAFAQQPTDTSWMTEQPAAGDDVALLETPPLDEQGDQPAADQAQAADQPMASGDMKLGGGSGSYTVQVVAYREKEKADKIVDNLGVAGYPAFIEKVAMKGTDWYTVRIGRYATKAEANEAVKSFAAEIRANYFVDRVRSQ